MRVKVTTAVLAVLVSLVVVLPATASTPGVTKQEMKLLIKTAKKTGRTPEQVVFVAAHAPRVQAHASHNASYLHNCWPQAGFPCDGALSDDDAQWFMVVELVWNHTNAQTPSFHGAYHRVNNSSTWAWNVKYKDNRLNHVCLVDVDYVAGVPYRYYADCAYGDYKGPFLALAATTRSAAQAARSPLRATAVQVNPAMLNVHLRVCGQRDGWARVWTEGKEEVEGSWPRFSRGRPYMRRVKLHKGCNRWRQPAFRYEDLEIHEYLARYPNYPVGVPAAWPVKQATVNQAFVYGHELGKKLPVVEARP